MLGLVMFNRLSPREQGELVISKGTIIAHRRNGDWNIGLYSLSNFFVEFWVAKKDNEVISKIETFMSRACLEPYLKEIDISEILKD